MFDSGVFTKKLGKLEIGSKLSEEEQELLKRAIDLDYDKPNEPSTTREKDKSK